MDGRTRRIIAAVALVAVGACKTAPPDACDALARCVGVTNPFLLGETAATYGPGGSCWEEAGRACEAECLDQLVALYLPTGSGACDPEPITGEPMLNEPEFYERLDHTYCEAYEECTDGGDCGGWWDDTCWGRFDPEIAQLCLDLGGIQCREQRFHYPDPCQSYCVDD